MQQPTWSHSQQPMIFTQQPCRKNPPNPNNYYPTNPKPQSKPKTKIQKKPQRRRAIIQLQQPKKRK
jgi:hypothetical protein